MYIVEANTCWKPNIIGARSFYSTFSRLPERSVAVFFFFNYSFISIGLLEDLRRNFIGRRGRRKFYWYFTAGAMTNFCHFRLAVDLSVACNDELVKYAGNSL